MWRRSVSQASFKPSETPEVGKADDGEKAALVMAGVGLGIAGIAYVALSLAVGGFFLLMAYGVVVIIFKFAFGVHLPNPFGD